MKLAPQTAFQALVSTRCFLLAYAFAASMDGAFLTATACLWAAIGTMAAPWERLWEKRHG